MKWHPNSAKHKANHKGYKGKPTHSQVNALLGLYSGNIPLNNPIEKKINNQLDLFG